MRSDDFDSTESLPVFLSALSDCAYLPDRQARSAFIDPRMHLNASQREMLVHLGFRRSGPSHYRPVCEGCQACESTRVDVTKFKANRAQRRCLSSNDDLIAAWQPAEFSDEKFALYNRYLSARHKGGGMEPDDAEGFRQFLCSSGRDECQHLMIRNSRGDLVAVAVADRLLSGYSAVYTFFDPEQTRRSLGRYAVLRLIQLCRSAGLPWLYLGYTIEGCRKMQYKTEYQPQQRLVSRRWQYTTD